MTEYSIHTLLDPPDCQGPLNFLYQDPRISTAPTPISTHSRVFGSDKSQLLRLVDPLSLMQALIAARRYGKPGPKGPVLVCLDLSGGHLRG